MWPNNFKLYHLGKNSYTYILGVTLNRKPLDNLIMAAWFDCNSQVKSWQWRENIVMKQRIHSDNMGVLSISFYADLLGFSKKKKRTYSRFCINMNMFSLKYMTFRWRGHYQYSFNEHVIVLLNELRSTEHKTAKELHSCLSHTSGVVHEATMNATLHIQLKTKRGDCQALVNIAKYYECKFDCVNWLELAQHYPKTLDSIPWLNK